MGSCHRAMLARAFNVDSWVHTFLWYRHQHTPTCDRHPQKSCVRRRSINFPGPGADTPPPQQTYRAGGRVLRIDVYTTIPTTALHSLYIFHLTYDTYRVFVLVVILVLTFFISF